MGSSRKVCVVGNLSTNMGHIVTAVIIIIAVTVLAWHGTISGSDALTIIGVLGGVSVGGSVASSSAGGSVPVSADSQVSTGTSTSGVTTNASSPVASSTTPSNSTSTAGVV